MTCQGCGKPIPSSRRGAPRKWCSERCRKASYGDPCVNCGARTCYGAQNARKPNPRCDRCAHEKEAFKRRDAREARRREIEQRWQEGESLRQIAAALDTTAGSIGAQVAQMRKEGGYDVPHRNRGIAAWHRAHPEHMARARQIKLNRLGVAV